MTRKSLGILLGTLLLGFVSAGTAALAGDDRTEGPDPTATRIIQERLAQDPTLKNERIQVSVVGDRATLKGVVASPAEKQQAARMAMVGNVRYVDNQLEVKSSGAKETISGAAVTTELQTRYVAEWGLRSKVHVTTTNGVVTLTGVVANEAERRRALEIANSTGGVQRFDDELRVAAAPAAPR